MPRRTIQQIRLGFDVSLAELDRGDLVFTSGFIDYYDFDPSDGVGHVGIATGEETIIHAANRKLGLVETPVSDFLRKYSFRVVRRIFHSNQTVITLSTPIEREVEFSDDIRWLILQTLPKRS